MSIFSEMSAEIARLKGSLAQRLQPVEVTVTGLEPLLLETADGTELEGAINLGLPLQLGARAVAMIGDGRVWVQAQVSEGDLSLEDLSSDIEAARAGAELTAQTVAEITTVVDAAMENVQTSLDVADAAGAEAEQAKQDALDAWNKAMGAEAGLRAEDSKGGDLVINGTGILGDNTNFEWATFNPDAPLGSSGSFVAPDSSSSRLSTQIIPVNPTKVYQQSIYAKQLVPGVVSRAYFGLAPVDAQGISITPMSYVYQARTMTTLAQPLNPGDTTVTLTSVPSGDEWIKNSHSKWIGFWNWEDPSGRVWPEATYTRNFQEWVSIEGNVVTLKTPYYGPALPAGNPVSRNYAGGTYMYTTMISQVVPEVWTQYVSALPITGLFNGEQETTVGAVTSFPQGTAGVRLMWLPNYGGANGGTQAFSGISFSDTSAAYSAAEAAKAAANQAEAKALGAQAAADAADGKATTASGKITVSASAPTSADAAGKPLGAIWEKRSGGVVSDRWILDAGSTWTQVKIGTNFIGENAIGSAQIIDASIGTAEIADLAVTNGKIGSLSVDKLTVTGGAQFPTAVISTLMAQQAFIDNLVASKVIIQGKNNKVGSILIEDGAITTPKMVAGSIDVDRLNAATFNAYEIAGAIITGGIVQTSSTANRGVKIDSGGLKGFNAAGAKTFDLNAITGKLSIVGDFSTGLPGTFPRISIADSMWPGFTGVQGIVDADASSQPEIKFNHEVWSGFNRGGVFTTSKTVGGVMAETLLGTKGSRGYFEARTISGSTVKSSLVMDNNNTRLYAENELTLSAIGKINVEGSFGNFTAGDVTTGFLKSTNIIVDRGGDLEPRVDIIRQRPNYLGEAYMYLSANSAEAELSFMTRTNGVNTNTVRFTADGIRHQTNVTKWVAFRDDLPTFRKVQATLNSGTTIAAGGLVNVTITYANQGTPVDAIPQLRNFPAGSANLNPRLSSVGPTSCVIQVANTGSAAATLGSNLYVGALLIHSPY